MPSSSNHFSLNSSSFIPILSQKEVSKASRYGFNKQEKDNQISGGVGNDYSFKYRMYDARLGRFFSIDPLSKEFPFYSSYQFASNNPILAKDLEGLESSENKNNAEKKTASKDQKKAETKTPDPKTPDPSTIGKNFDGSVYIGTQGNPKNYDGTDTYVPKPQDEEDDHARTHDMESGGIGYRSTDNLKGDAKFIGLSVKTLAKSVESAIVNPYIGAKPNKDNVSGKPITSQTGYRAAVGSTVLTILTATKVLLAVTVDPVVQVYDTTKDGINNYYQDIKDKTISGILTIQNWGN